MELSTALLGGAGINAASALIGGALNNVLNKDDTWQRNYDAQKEFAQNSIQWRVQDAQKAGVHPLYAVGMGQAPGYTPSSSFETNSMGEAIAQAGNKFGDAMGQLGMMNAMLQNDKLNQDVQTAKLNNEAKQLEIYQKMLENSMGQKSNVIPSYITDQGKTNLHLVAGGAGRVLPDQMESDIASLPADLSKVLDTQYNASAVEKLPVPKNVDRYYHLSPLGFSYTDLPKGANRSELGFWGNATNAYYKWYKGGEKATKWLLNKFYSW
ncbi:DNA pilot protein [Microvirus sp.]|nr:DNA pilot protein [Microvirus sp.]